MGDASAKVIDLEEFRRRRASLASAKAELMPMAAAAAVPAWTTGPAYCVWYPVWYWVPVTGG